jgi:hypothetical protein
MAHMIAPSIALKIRDIAILITASIILLKVSILLAAPWFL